MPSDLFNRATNRIYTVSELTRDVRRILEQSFPAVWVSGEVSNFRQPMAGHMYFSLKDAGSQMRAVLFKSAQARVFFTPADGMEVLAHGRLSVYEPRGDYQIICDAIEPKGLGALQAAFEELKTRLEGEGLFASERKSALPIFPSTIGLVTSPTGAAARDFLKTAVRQFSGVHVVIYPVRVQGASAAAEICRALAWFNASSTVDVIAIVRGGGSLEDLWPFNEEPLVRAIADSSVPVVTGVGHETDFTLADFAADRRALTPTDAAHLTVPDAEDLRGRILSLQDDEGAAVARLVGRHRLAVERVVSRLERSRDIIAAARQIVEDRSLALADAARRHVREARNLVDRILRRAAENHPRQQIHLAQVRLGNLSRRLHVAAAAGVKVRRRDLGSTRRLLDNLSPLAVLDRGYSIVFDRRGLPVRDAQILALGDTVRLRFATGSADAQVVDTRSDDQGKPK